ncbi:N-acetylmuramoyl-L-alanine amidase [Aurantimonas sp. VKM B-3413]|uniref:N-acetylmuramoyl-L-alanine amidase n=1 Tax=Aurantimonas sp. VKM B-3413 TaxID=2779401 RepID=UPI001E3EE56A|nr:N-acetylmuramoyl-L-alanine amidase [Aurantimonas sp. VKM B-3413]
MITAFEQTPTEDGLRARFTLNGETKVRLLHLHNPDRIAVDFVGTVPAITIAPARDNPIVETIRHGLVAKDRYRVIFRLKSPGTGRLEQSRTDAGEIVTLSVGPDERSTVVTRRTGADAAKAAADAAAPAKGERPAVAQSRTRQLVIVVDPGHGGEDNGAVSPSGTFEKDINLAMARAIRESLSEFPGVKVVLTRDGDTFIPLDERSAIARKEHADLFISVHADSIRYNDLRGATVYTLSDRASDELSRQIAASENAADRFAGPEWQQSEPDVFDILLDLTRRETVSFSEHFATSLVTDLSRDKIDLIKNPKRSASFVVLKAPDVPSVLVECGFLSNPDDETLLKDDSWRKKMANAIAEAVVTFFRGKDASRSVDAG